MTNLYNDILDDATSRFQESAWKDMQAPEFNWDQLIELLLIEDSALQDVFSETTLQSADLCDNAKRLHQSYTELPQLEELNKGDS